MRASSAATTAARFSRCARRWASSNTKWTAGPTASARTAWNPPWITTCSASTRPSSPGAKPSFELSPQECGELFHEGTLFYFRYVRLFQLKDWARTIRDTARNLRAFDFLHRYARREEDQQFLEKWRPYILRVNASATVMQAMEKGAYDEALKIARDAIRKIESLEELEDDTFKFERERSIMALRELESQIQKNRPLSELEQLEHQLRRAIDRQEFERAAQLRDRIRELRQQHIC